MWRVVAAIFVCCIGFAVLVSGSMPVQAQGGYAGEAGPEVPLPSIAHEQKGDAPASATNSAAGSPDLPARKPRKPVTPVQTSAEQKKVQKQPPAGSSRSERDRYLCKALQACRDEFIRCKAKIKHPDQSEAWSVAKEECGAHYKACVQKDFRGGEWFFTRWFYFQRLDCS